MIIRLMYQKNKYYSAFEAENKQEVKHINLSEFCLEEYDILTESAEWLVLKKFACNLIEETRT